MLSPSNINFSNAVMHEPLRDLAKNRYNLAFDNLESEIIAGKNAFQEMKKSVLPYANQTSLCSHKIMGKHQ